MGRIQNLKFDVDPVLTEIALGYSNSEFVGRQLFPEVEVEKENGVIPQFGKEAFRIYNTERALRANSNVIPSETYTTLSYAMTEHDLAVGIDYRERDESALPTKMERFRTKQVIDGIDLKIEKMVAEMSQDANNYLEGHKLALTSNDVWSTGHEDSDPIPDIDSAKETIRLKIGKYPNVAVMGTSTYNVLKRHPKIVEQVQYTNGGMVTTEILQELLGVEKLVVGSAAYVDDSGSFVDLWNDNFILAYVPGTTKENRSEFEPSFGYTLVKTGYPQVDTYVSEDQKTQFIRNTKICVPVLSGSAAGYIITNTKA